jgi:hypothetical protein
MDMIRHQAPAQDFQTVLRSRRGDQIQIEAPAILVKKGLLAIIRPLRDVTGDVGNHNTDFCWQSLRQYEPAEESLGLNVPPSPVLVPECLRPEPVPQCYAAPLSRVLPPSAGL